VVRSSGRWFAGDVVSGGPGWLSMP
jgi:hypothetical protein